MVRAALFDAGDTLLHWNVHRRERFAWLCTRLGIASPDDPSRMLRAARAADQFFYAERDDFWSDVWWIDQYEVGLRELGLDRDQAIAMANLRRELPTNFVLDADAIPVLSGLKQRGFKIGLVSNWDGTLTQTCQEVGLMRYIDYVGDSGMFGEPKPSAAFFLHVLEQLGVRPDEAFHVGDHYDADVAGARGAGITPILIDLFEHEQRDCELRVRELKEVLVIADRYWPATP